MLCLSLNFKADLRICHIYTCINDRKAFEQGIGEA